MPDGSPWPRVSIVTPSFNQGQFIEETIRSVLLQGYPNLEYIIIDGGSNDGSVEIIRKYEPWLAYWISEPDRGQAHAINKGFAHATGDWIAWLNSDDVYCPGAVQTQVGYLLAHPDVDVVYGDCRYVNQSGEAVRYAYSRPFDFLELLRFTIPYQPTLFMRRSVVTRTGWLDCSFHHAVDSEYWLRLHSNGARFAYNPRLIAIYRLHSSSKTVSGDVKRWDDEWERLIAMYAPVEHRARLRADLSFQIAIQLVENGRVGASLRYARRGWQIRPTRRVLVYLAALFEKLTGLRVYSSLLDRWMRVKSRGRGVGRLFWFY